MPNNTNYKEFKEIKKPYKSLSLTQLTFNFLCDIVNISYLS